MFRHDVADTLKQFQKEGIQRGAFRIFLIDILLQVMQVFIDIPVKPVPVNPRNGSGSSALLS